MMIYFFLYIYLLLLGQCSLSVPVRELTLGNQLSSVVVNLVPDIADRWTARCSLLLSVLLLLGYPFVSACPDIEMVCGGHRLVLPELGLCSPILEVLGWPARLYIHLTFVDK